MAFSRCPTLSPRSNLGGKLMPFPPPVLPGKDINTLCQACLDPSNGRLGQPHYPHFTNGKAEAQRHSATCPRSHRFRGGTLLV